MSTLYYKLRFIEFFVLSYLDEVTRAFCRETVKRQSNWLVFIDDDVPFAVHIIAVITWVIWGLNDARSICQKVRAVYKKK